MSIEKYVIGGVAGILVGSIITYVSFVPYKSKINSLEQENAIYQDSITQLKKQNEDLIYLLNMFVEQDKDIKATEELEKEANIK